METLPTPFCCDPCTPAGVSSTPGPQGPPGADGADGTNGLSAYAIAVGGESMPNDDGASSVTITTSTDTSWMAVGQVLYVQFWGYLRVTAVPTPTSVTLLNLDDGTAYADNSDPGTLLPALAKISPGGWQGPTGTTDASLFLQRASNLSDLLDPGAARGNLGLGTAATYNAGIFNGQLPVNDGDIDPNEVVVGTISGIATRDAATVRGLLDLTKGTADTDIPPVDNAAGLTPGDIVVATPAGVETQSTATIRTLLGITTQDMLLFRHQASDGASSGTFSSSLSFPAAPAVPINTEVVDTGNHGSIAGNQITLAAGTYRYSYAVIGNGVDEFQAAIYDVTNAAVIADSYGSVGYSLNGGTMPPGTSMGQGRFTLAGSAVIELRARSANSQPSNGYGITGNFGVGEVWSWIEFTRES